MSLPARILRWILRFRHRCGYGVHSPYAFQLITDVIYNTLPYYAYAPLAEGLPYNLLLPGHYEPASGLSLKDLRLIFRLANHQAPTHIAHHGASPATLAHLAAARTTATITDLADLADKTEHPCTAEAKLPCGTETNLPYTAEFIYLDAPHHIAELTKHGLDTLPQETMIVVRSIHRDSTALAQWLTLRDDPAVTLTLDLWRFGIALRRPKTTHENYLVNYF